MNSPTKIILGVSAIILVIGGVWYFMKKKKKPKGTTKSNSLDISKDSVSVPKDALSIPKDYSNNELVKQIQDKTNYIHGTLETMKVVDNKIVNPKSGNPYSIGLLQGVWRIHKKQFDKLKLKINNSNELKGVKDFANKLVSNVDNRNTSIFSPKQYSYEAQWYKDYLKKG